MNPEFRIRKSEGKDNSFILDSDFWLLNSFPNPLKEDL